MASCNFRDEIGRGGACVVYKGLLSDSSLHGSRMGVQSSDHFESRCVQYFSYGVVVLEMITGLSPLSKL
ncbi:hypothetical protein OSB04_012923 [Centaurea solstitialis]|uniref:Uncharacterized protein n=1 Tax=Centaurea solstitialis TaxID=347529 RepID=A0AA38TE05_9ASTR|nr:hypothetical protein OSB04_012923 [Centaurea solstitialis]